VRVLIAGHSLGEMGGVQRYERDLALWLLRRGHSPVVYGTELGVAARELTRLTIPVTDDLRTIAAPIDVIHGDSPVETMAALLHFPDTPALFVCHGWGHVARTTPHFPRVIRYVAVDDTCADRLLLREGVAPEKVSVLLNGVDIDAFRQRAPLPPRPRRAVVFGNLAHELTFVPVLRNACRQMSIELDVVSASAGTAVPDPESILGQYDIAFAKAKCAIEAMACGLAVILCGDSGIGGMVRSADLDQLWRLNFGIRTLRKPLTEETILAELALYDPDDARAVSDRIRATAPTEALHQSLLALYETVIEEYARVRTEGDRLAENRAAAMFLHDLSVRDRYREVHLWKLAKAAQRFLEMPVVGRVASPLFRLLIGRR